MAVGVENVHELRSIELVRRADSPKPIEPY